MTDRILIYLPNDDITQVSWVTINSSNIVLDSAEHGELKDIPRVSDADVIVFLPPSEVLLTEASLPKLTRSRLLQALPFALEEQLIDDVEDLHFALGEQQADGLLPVAVISHQKMLHWLNILSQHQIAPRAILPAIFLLPYASSQWHINTDDEYSLVRTGPLSGFACEKENLTLLLDAKLAEESEPDTVKLVKTELSKEQLLERISSVIVTQPRINLLQGKYQPKPQSNQSKKIWLIASYLVLSCVLVAFLGNLISFLILHHRASRLETEINQIYMRNFPQAKSIVAPRERMEDKLRKATGQANKNNFLVLLGDLGRTLAAVPGLRIQRLEFREQQLTLEVTAANFENLDNFTRHLSELGLSVKQQNAAATGSQVQATLMIRAGTS